MWITLKELIMESEFIFRTLFTIIVIIAMTVRLYARIKAAKASVGKDIPRESKRQLEWQLFVGLFGFALLFTYIFLPQALAWAALHHKGHLWQTAPLRHHSQETLHPQRRCNRRVPVSHLRSADPWQCQHN